MGLRGGREAYRFVARQIISAPMGSDSIFSMGSDSIFFMESDPIGVFLTPSAFF